MGSTNKQKNLTTERLNRKGKTPDSFAVDVRLDSSLPSHNAESNNFQVYVNADLMFDAEAALDLIDEEYRALDTEKLSTDTNVLYKKTACSSDSTCGIDMLCMRCIWPRFH